MRCWCSAKRRVPVLPETGRTCRQWIVLKGAAFYRPLRATVFHRIPVQVISHQWVNQPPRCPILRRRVPQNKAPLQGGERIVTPSVKTAVQPGGVSRFTIALNGAFCFRTYPLLRISWYRGVPFWNSLHLVAENSATKDHSAVLRAGSQAAAHPPGCPQFWGDPEHHGIFHLHTA